MAEVSDPALAPIGTVQRTRIGREATEPMRQDIRLLGGILSDTIREQNGEQVFDLGPPGSAGTALSEPSLPSRQTSS